MNKTRNANKLGAVPRHALEVAAKRASGELLPVPGLWAPWEAEIRAVLEKRGYITCEASPRITEAGRIAA